MNKYILGTSLLLFALVLSGCGNTDSQEKAKIDQQAPAAPAGVETKFKPESEKKLSASAVGMHNSKESCWLIISGRVFDMTAFIPSHPGGPDKLAAWCGKEATAAFDGMPKHSRDKLDKFLLGNLEE